MADSDKVDVYLFRWTGGEGRAYAPLHMWGTPEAIAALRGCTPVPESARKVHPKLLEGGFFFEQVDSSFVEIEEAHPVPFFGAALQPSQS